MRTIHHTNGRVTACGVVLHELRAGTLASTLWPEVTCDACRARSAAAAPTVEELVGAAAAWIMRTAAANGLQLEHIVVLASEHDAPQAAFAVKDRSLSDLRGFLTDFTAWVHREDSFPEAA